MRDRFSTFWNYLTNQRAQDDWRQRARDRATEQHQALMDIADAVALFTTKSSEVSVDHKVNVDVNVPDGLTFDEQLATAIVGATAAKMLKAPPAQLDNYGDDVYRVVGAVIAARNRNQNATNAAHWTPLS
jgi:hypothetical protein